MALSTPLNDPSLSISLSLEPPIYRTTDPTVPVLSVHATLQASRPITVCSWHTILHPRQALQQNYFEILDKSNNNVIIPQLAKKTKRPAIMRQFGTPDEQLFVTLMPQLPYTVRTPFGPPPTQMQDAWTQEPVYGVRGLKKGEYTLRVSRAVESKCQIGWWRYGTKEENLERASSENIDTVGDCSLGASEEPSPLPVDVTAVLSVDFSVE